MQPSYFSPQRAGDALASSGQASGISGSRGTKQPSYGGTLLAGGNNS